MVNCGGDGVMIFSAAVVRVGVVAAEKENASAIETITTNDASNVIPMIKPPGPGSKFIVELR